MNQQFNGVIRRFCDYSQEQMAKMQAELGLRMPAPALRYCANYYRTREKKRDPRVAELRFLDALVTLPADSISTAITELYTNDSFVAVTYADMMNKRRELHPEASSPITLGEALGMATAYLNRSGKKPWAPGTSPALLNADQESDALANDAVGISGSSFALRMEGRSPRSLPQPGDLFVLLTRGENLSEWLYPTQIDSFLRQPDIQASVRQSLAVSKNGLLCTVLPLVRGICFDLRRLTSDGSAAPLEILLREFEGRRILLLPKEKTDAVLKAAAEKGFRPMVFASVLNTDRTMFAFSAADSVSLETAFVRMMIPRAACAARLPSEQSDQPDEIAHTPVTAQSCPYLCADDYVPQRVTNHKQTVAAAFCKTGHRFYRSAVQTTLGALLSSAIGGGDYAKDRLAIGVTLPSAVPDTERMGEAIATVLGVYRVQTELGIPAAALAMSNSETAEHPELTVFSLSGTPGVPSHFVSAGSRIYCVSAIMNESGLPDFEALRHLLAEIKKRHLQKSIRSARVVCGETLTEALSSMHYGRLACNAETANEEAPLSLALLLESADALPFACIGSVRETPATEPYEAGDGITDIAEIAQAPESPALPDLSRSLIWNENCEVVLLASSSDMGAQALASRVRGNGAVCRIFHEGANPDPLSRAVLTAQLFIVCGDIALPQSERMEFALRTMRSAGGSLLCLGENSRIPEDIPALRYPNGIPEAVLAQIFVSKNRSDEIL